MTVLNVTKNQKSPNPGIQYSTMPFIFLAKVSRGFLQAFDSSSRQATIIILYLSTMGVRPSSQGAENSCILRLVHSEEQEKSQGCHKISVRKGRILALTES